MKLVNVWFKEIMLPTVSIIISIWAFIVLLEILNDIYILVARF